MAALIGRCTCGKVELEATGAPIISAVCYCDDCQAGAQQIEALPSVGRVREPDGGVGYLFYLKDRVRIQKGADLLRRVPDPVAGEAAGRESRHAARSLAASSLRDCRFYGCSNVVDTSP
jgi:hypothetical protein